MLRNLIGCSAACLLAATLSSSSASAQNGPTAVVRALNKMTRSFSDSKSLEYTSVVRTSDGQGSPVTLYIHARLQKPNLVHLTVSHTGIDAPDADIINTNGAALNEYDPQQSRFAQDTAPSVLSVPIVLPNGFSGAAPALSTVSEFFRTNPFQDLIPSDEDTPLTYTRRDPDLPGTMVITAILSASSTRQEQAKMWLDSDTSMPQRYQKSVMNDAVERVSYREDFITFQINPTFPPDAFICNPPDTAKKVVSEESTNPITPDSIGAQAPNFTLKDLNGKSVSLASLKGKVILIDFWASWCPPCKMELPHIQSIYNDLAPKGLVVLAINTSDKKDAMAKFLQQTGYSMPTLFDEPGIGGSLYGVTGIPTVFILDKRGKVAKTWVGFEDNGEAEMRHTIASLGIK